MFRHFIIVLGILAAPSVPLDGDLLFDPISFPKLGPLYLQRL